ncbi:MAG TPA: carboxylating nicotinate-nucleotide diphosphorylase [Planktothrix sp.]|jgi:nicotinate-nucleotide pyrophosphorylase (carboxylating)
MQQTLERKMNETPDTDALMQRAIELAIEEDLGSALTDLTTDSIVSEKVTAVGAVYCKQAGVIAGLEIFKMVMQRFDRRIQIKNSVGDGAFVSIIPTTLLTFSGPAASILKAERLSLNLLQRMSGIATITRQFVNKAGQHSIQILDTRKTTPGLRVFERQAVALAGGTNHRFGLFDAILIKDNHVRLAGGITPAIKSARAGHPHLPVEVETTTLAEVEDALQCQAERILLDNMTAEMIRDAVELIAGRAYIEVSGGVNLANLNQFLIRGVNGISIGALTHSAPSLDISLEVETFV